MRKRIYIISRLVYFSGSELVNRNEINAERSIYFALDVLD